MAVPVATQPSFTVGEPEVLFAHEGISRYLGQHYDVSADGQRLPVIESVGKEPAKI